MTRHRLDWFSLVSGLVLTTTAVLALTGITTEVGRWAGPTVLIGVGLLVLAAVVTSGRDRTGAAADRVDDSVDEEPADADGEDVAATDRDGDGSED